MYNYYLRILVQPDTALWLRELTDFLESAAQLTDLRLWESNDYWKNPGQKELYFRFSSHETPQAIQTRLADHWQADTADARYDTIHIPHAVFLWLST